MKTQQDKEQLKLEIDHIFESGANEIRIFEMVTNFIEGYSQCQEDSKNKKYTEEDMRKSIFTSFLLGVDRGVYSKELEDELINSLNKK